MAHRIVVAASKILTRPTDCEVVTCDELGGAYSGIRLAVCFIRTDIFGYIFIVIGQATLSAE